MTKAPPLPPDAFRPKPIAPLPQGTVRPFWSVMVPTYNREQYLEQTLRSILRQDPGPERMQLCVVDNATTTHDVRAMLGRLAGDRIEYVRHAENIGGIRNINTCFENARGQWVHVLHDDDIVLPGFYAATERMIDRYPNATLFIGPVLGINDAGYVTGLSAPIASKEGIIDDFLLHQAIQNKAPTQTNVVPRRVYEMVGGYAEELVFTPDWEMAFRAAACGAAVTTALPYAAYRWHGGSDTSKLLKGNRHLNEMTSVIDNLCDRLPAEARAKLPANRYQFVAMAAEHFASMMTDPADRRSRIEHLGWAYRLDPNRHRLRQWLSARVRAVLG